MDFVIQMLLESTFSITCFIEPFLSVAWNWIRSTLSVPWRHHANLTSVPLTHVCWSMILENSRSNNISKRVFQRQQYLLSVQWASYQIRKIAGCACAGNARNVFSDTAGYRSRYASRHADEILPTAKSSRWLRDQITLHVSYMRITLCISSGWLTILSNAVRMR